MRAKSVFIISILPLLFSSCAQKHSIFVNDKYEIKPSKKAKNACSIGAYRGEVYLYNIFEIKLSKVSIDDINELRLSQEFYWHELSGPYMKDIDFQYYVDGNLLTINVDEDNEFYPDFKPFYRVFLSLKNKIFYSFKVYQIIEGEEYASPATYCM